MKEKLYQHWCNEKPLTFENKKYSVHKMSYGDYFLEPFKKSRRETDGFAVGTVWFNSQGERI